MIFELLEECNENDTVTVIMDNHTFNQILMMLVCEAYHKGLKENADMDDDRTKDDS